MSASAPSGKLDDLVELLPLLHQWQQVRRAGSDLSRNAFVIEFGGMPKAGKSSAIENVRHFFTHGPMLPRAESRQENFRRIGYRVHTPAEGVSLRTPNYLKNSLIDFNTWAGAYAVQELLQAAHDDHHDLVVLDRGPWDAGCWLEYWASNPPRSGSDDDIGRVKAFFQLRYWMTRSDLHVVLTVDPEEAARREQQHRLIRHGGASSKSELMARMKSIYSERFGELQDAKEKSCPHVGNRAALLIDTTTKTKEEVARLIIQAVFDVLEAKLAYHRDEFVFTTDFFLERLVGYMPRTRSKNKTHIQERLPDLVDRANALNPKQRQRLRQELTDRAFPQDRAQLVEQRVTADSIMNSLNKLLSEVQTS